ncbi:MAG: DUF2240 family protein [Candidatus Thermoplasmatota archaeon]
MDELKTAVALLFKRKGKELLSDDEFILSASMDLHWLSPNDARKLLVLGLENGILTRKDGKITPNFSYKSITAPLDFKPNIQQIEQTVTKTIEGESLFLRIVDEIAKNTKMDRRTIIAEVNKKQERINAEVEAIAILVGIEHGVELKKYIKNVEEEIIKKLFSSP